MCLSMSEATHGVGESLLGQGSVCESDVVSQIIRCAGRLRQEVASWKGVCVRLQEHSSSLESINISIPLSGTSKGYTKDCMRSLP